MQAANPSERTPLIPAVLPAFILGAYPIAFVVGVNAGIIPLDAFVILRSLAVALGATAVCLWASQFAQRDLATRALWLGWVLLPFNFFGLAAEMFRQLSGLGDAWRSPFAIGYLVAIVWITTAAYRPWQVRRRDVLSLNVVAIAFILTSQYPAVSRALAARNDGWRGPADAMTRLASQTGGSKARAVADRDIYYLVLDGFGRPDVLKERYSLDLGGFLAHLQAKGFYIPQDSRSNYSQTFLSLASALNMGYVDGIAAAMGPGSRDRRPLRYLIDRNGLMQLAKGAGYRVIGIGSDYTATEELPAADVCICRRHGLDPIEQSAIAFTPLVALPLTRWTIGAHRRRVLESFAALEEAASVAGPKFVFAHILAPHPPFIFAPDGGARRPSDADGFDDGDHFRGSHEEYVSGYRDQVQFVSKRLTEVVDRLLERPGPRPVILVHGDHGPGSRLRWDDPQASDMHERMAIFAAFYPADQYGGLYPAISPVNLTRAIATRYLGAALPPLPDRTSFSTWTRPYEFIPVEADDPR